MVVHFRCGRIYLPHSPDVELTSALQGLDFADYLVGHLIGAQAQEHQFDDGHIVLVAIVGVLRVFDDGLDVDGLVEVVAFPHVEFLLQFADGLFGLLPCDTFRLQLLAEEFVLLLHVFSLVHDGHQIVLRLGKVHLNVLFLAEDLSFFLANTCVFHSLSVFINFRTANIRYEDAVVKFCS